MPSREGKPLELQASAGPTRRHAHGIGIKGHTGSPLGIEPDDPGPEGNVVTLGTLAYPQRSAGEVTILLRQTARDRLGWRSIRAHGLGKGLLVLALVRSVVFHSSK